MPQSFQGSSAKLLVKRTLTSSQIDEIEGLLAQHGMRLDRRPPNLGISPRERGPVPESEPERLEDSTLLVRRTIRSGQRLHYDGNVVVMGDVNPGAEIVCSGDILVLGALRGVAHAGAEGKTDAIVFAFRLNHAAAYCPSDLTGTGREASSAPRPRGCQVVGMYSAFGCSHQG